MFKRVVIGIVTLLLCATSGSAQVVDWPPDLIIDPAHLTNYDIVDSVEPGRVHLRFANGTANIGLGKLFIHPETPSSVDSDVPKPLLQHIFRSDGTFWEHDAGEFVHHPNQGKFIVSRGAHYRLREILPGNGVGAVIAETYKSNCCLLDSAVYDSSLTNFTSSGRFSFCGVDNQGISVGFEDIYNRLFPGQWIDITELRPGNYWLESEANPERRYLESNYDNNVNRAIISIDLRQYPADPLPAPQVLPLFLSCVSYCCGGRVRPE